MLRDLFRSLPVVLIVLAAPIIPFVLMGGSIDAWFARWSAAQPDRLSSALVVIGLLATDIFLPVPASLVSTFGGGQLGWLLGTAASWAGMTIGAVAGFALARWCGAPLARRFSHAASLERTQALGERYGPGVIIITRGIPLLAEASVLLLGVERLPWRKFLPPLMLSNLGLSLVYASFGDLAQQYNSTPLALAVSILLPVLAAFVVQRFWRGERQIGDDARPPA
jgi:uncharacterized membrane protein YdjX (TVP38/TMEM64 family)